MTHLHDATNPNCTHYQENGTPQANAPTSSRRRRLWELTHACHCPVVGVCIPLDTLRRLVNKALGGKALADAPRAASSVQTQVFASLDNEASNEVQRVIAANAGPAKHAQR